MDNPKKVDDWMSEAADAVGLTEVVSLEQVLQAWVENNLVEQSLEVILAAFRQYPKLIAAYLKGKTRDRLKNRFNKERSFECDETGGLEGDALAAAKSLLLALQALNQANKNAKGDEQYLLNIALVDLTECVSLNAKALSDVALESGEKVVDFIIRLVNETPDECNNVFYSTVVPYLVSRIQGKNLAQLLKELIQAHVTFKV